MNKEEEVTNIYLPELHATIATKITLHKLRIHNNILYKGNKKVTLCKVNALSVIIDKIKELLGLEHFNRSIVTFPSQEKYTMELHNGYERKMYSSENSHRDVIKLKFFRWIVGLSNGTINDIIVRCIYGRKYFVSYKECSIDCDRDFNISFNDDINPGLIVKEMLYGFEDLSYLKNELLKIITSVDRSYIYIADIICKKINLYDF